MPLQQALINHSVLLELNHAFLRYNPKSPHFYDSQRAIWFFSIFAPIPLPFLVKKASKLHIDVWMIVIKIERWVHSLTMRD